MNTTQLAERLIFHARLVLGEETPLEARHLDERFEALGIDSLHLTEITVAMLTELDVYVPMAQLARAPTPSAFLALLAEELEPDLGREK